MFQEMTSDIWNAIMGAFPFQTPLSFILMFAIATYSGLRLSSLKSIFNRSVLATITFGVATYLIQGLSSRDRFSIQEWDMIGFIAWGNFMDTSVLQIIGLVGCFAVLIMGVFMMKKLARR